MKLKPILNEIVNKPFITDNEENLEVKDATTGETIMSLDRYGVWMVGGKGKYEVVDTSDDLQELMKKYNVSSEYIYKLREK